MNSSVTMKQLSKSNKHMNNSSVNKADQDYAYDDDFEELDSYIQDKSQESSPSKGVKDGSTRKDIFHKADETSTADSDLQVEKGQRESSGQMPTEKDRRGAEDDNRPEGRPISVFDELQSDDSEPEPDGEVLFTEDQHRAMMELMAQKHFNGDYSGDPPEYNVKERLKELNAELAKEPDPDDREHRVGFKANLVDLVAPPPDLSDDEESSRKPEASDENTGGSPGQVSQDKKNQFVVERDGKFDIVAHNELSSAERAMFDIPDHERGGFSSGARNANSKLGSGERHGQAGEQNSNVRNNKENMHPLPPSKPRPNTASNHSRRSVHLMLSPRPQTASSSHNANHGSMLQDFNYNSPYAMSGTEKERAQERARLREQQRKEEEKRRQKEEEYRRQEAEDAFRAWLQQKMEEDRRRPEEDEDSKKDREEKAKENEEAFRGWLKQKQTQLKREKLLKKREDQGMKDGYYIRSRDECEQAYKEWLKKKYAEFRQQKTADKERMKTFQVMARRSRKHQMIARASRQSQAFRYVDYYGYRF